EHRKKITVLYQKTRDGKIKQFCEKLDFKEVLELNGGWQKLGENFEIWCEPFDGGDSWCAFRVGGKVILNLNDCVVSSQSAARKILNRIACSVDVLMTQFSYASWAGNSENTELRRSVAEEKLERIQTQIEVIRPEMVI